MPDLIINNNVYEIKSLSNKNLKVEINNEKYVKVNFILAKQNKFIQFVNLTDICNIFNISYEEDSHIDEIKRMLENDEIKIYFNSFNGKRKAKLFEKFDKKYLNKNLITWRSKENEMGKN